MKRFIAAVSLSVLAVPAFALIDDDYDESHRAFFRVTAQPVVERPAPKAEKHVTSNLTTTNLTTIDHAASPAASAGNTAADRRSAIEESFKSPWATGPWANDHHFIAPQ